MALTAIVAFGCSAEPGPADNVAATADDLIIESDTRGEIAAAGVPFLVDCRAFRRKVGAAVAPAGSREKPEDPAQPEVSGALGTEVSLPGAATLVVVGGPAGPFAIDGQRITIARPGSYQVACLISGTGLQDLTPATLIAEAGAPADPQTVVVDAATGDTVSTVASGTKVRVLCSGDDVLGNAVTDQWTVETTGQVLDIQPNVATTLTKVGTITFACRAANQTDATPSTVVVKVGTPKHLWTKLSPSTVKAGHASEVTCQATDAAGNTIANFPFSISHSAKLALKKLYLTGTVAGQHAVKCVPESIDWKYFEIHGALLNIQPGPPASLLVAKVPEKGVYKRKSKVDFVPLVRDEFGNAIADWPVSMDVPTPKTGFKVLANKPGDMQIRFDLDATYDVVFAADATALATTTQVLVDGAPPLLTIDYPPWGSTLSLKPSIQLYGKAGDDGAGIKDLFVNGIKTFPDAADDWFLQVGAVHGLNPVEAIATDLGDQKTRATRGFYYSNKFYPTDASKPKAHLVPAALQVFLGQDFFDDGVHDPTKPDDIATIIEIIAGATSLASLLPGGLSGAGADVSMSNFTMAKPTVQITTHEGGLEVRIVLKDISVDIAVKAKLKLGPIKTTIKTNGTLTVKSVDVSSWLKLGVSAGKVTASASWTKAKIDGMKLSISGLAGLFNPVFNLILNGIKSDIEQGLEAELSKQLPAAFAAIFATLAINDTFELDPLIPGGSGKVTMVLASEVASIALTKAGMLASINMGFSSTKKVPHTNLGAIARAGCVGVEPDKFHIDTKARIQVAAHDDLINQMLYAMWYGGAFSGVISKGTLAGVGGGAIPLETSTIKIDPLLPPIIEGCPSKKHGDDSMLIRLQMGDAQSSIDVYSNDLVRLDVVTHIDAPLLMKFGKDDKGVPALIVTAAPDPMILHELHGLSKQLEEGKWAWIKAVDTLFGQLFANGLPGFDKPIVVPLPTTEVDMSAIAPGIAKGTMLKAAITAVTRKGGYGAFTMALQ